MVGLGYAPNERPARESERYRRRRVRVDSLSLLVRAVKYDGSVICWGTQTSGDCTPAAGTFVSVHAGASHTCGLKSDGTIACWGYYWSAP